MLFSGISDWFWGTKKSPKRQKKSSEKKRHRSSPRMIVSGYNLDHGLYRKKIDELTYDASLIAKMKRLINAYEIMYERFLNTPQFWDELQKIQDYDTGRSYHDMFTEKIVTGLVKTEHDRIRYADVIDTIYTLAIKYGFIPDETHENPKKKSNYVNHKTDTEYIIDNNSNDSSDSESNDDISGWLF